jgi:large subunit ribosomal protein L29
MKYKEINEKDDAGLKELLTERSRHLFDLRNQSVTSKLEDPSQIGKAKKDIARIKTVLRQRTIAASVKQA